MAFRYDRDMLGRIFHEQGIDAGEKWQIINALDQPIHLWDGRNVHQSPSYDVLGRVTELHVEGLGLAHIVERTNYGDDPTIADAKQCNLRGQVVEQYDQAGSLRVNRYDLGGTPLERERRLVADYKSIPDWSDPDAIEWMPETFQSRVRVDALGRPKEEECPDGTTRRYQYARDGSINHIAVSTDDGVWEDVPILNAVESNARGQRSKTVLGNTIEIDYTYSPLNFRMTQLRSRRPGNPDIDTASRLYQDLRYTYDPVGNITHTIDQAQQAQSDVIQNLNVFAAGNFTYDAFYQLTEATGRVHEALQNHDYDPSRRDQPNWLKGTRHLDINNGAAVQRYSRSYTYDLSGNIQQIRHRALSSDGDTSNNWQTNIWTSATSNRSLPATDLNDTPISDPESGFDANGNCLYLPHLRGFEWNYRNQLSNAVIIDRSDQVLPNDAEYYVYGGDGQRVRKIFERVVDTATGNLEVIEKIYLDGCEIKRVTSGENLTLERKTTHISDGSQRIALLHQWTLDSNGRETDDISLKKIHYQLSNHLGSSSLELDANGDVISYEEYFPLAARRSLPVTMCAISV